MMKWIGLVGSAVIAVAIWSLLFFIVFKDDNIENQKFQVDLEKSVAEELETEEVDKEVPIVSDDNPQIDDNNVVIVENLDKENMDELSELLTSTNIDKKEPKVNIVRNGDAIAYGEGISIDDLLEGILLED